MSNVSKKPKRKAKVSSIKKVGMFVPNPINGLGMLGATPTLPYIVEEEHETAEDAANKEDI